MQGNKNINKRKKEISTEGTNKEWGKNINKEHENRQTKIYGNSNTKKRGKNISRWK